ncbi:MAG: hypothetical protein PHS46_08665 [Candidatus Omnitrophica bacterium]|nr:hypothetical protein [Candidatus Omnitrophota bacterium]
MTVPSLQDMLDNVEIAINNILAGGAVQSYSVNGRNLQRCSLNELRDLRKQLKAEIAAGQTTPTRSYASFSRPS